MLEEPSIKEIVDINNTRGRSSQTKDFRVSLEKQRAVGGPNPPTALH